MFSGFLIKELERFFLISNCQQLLKCSSQTSCNEKYIILISQSFIIASGAQIQELLTGLSNYTQYSLLETAQKSSWDNSEKPLRSSIYLHRDGI